MFRKITLSVMLLLFGAVAVAQNPIIRDQFSADPSALVVGDKIYVFPSHDIPAPDDYPRKDWFCMQDYHVFSSENLTDWTDHGVILDQKDVPWGNPKGYSMWAPDCAENNGKYYFFFPDFMKRDGQEGQFSPFRVGVAVADRPEGPYTPRETPIEGVFGIDPCIFVDDDGQGYLVWPARGINIAKLNDDWSELAEEPTPVGNLPSPGLIEGPYLFKANGKYYMTFPWARKDTEVLAYSTADNIYGPYEFQGVFFEEWPNKCWTNHHSIINFKGQWYIFYHHNDYSPNFDKNRSVCADSLFFEPDGSIRMVKPTLRGIGVSKATSDIQMDRYSEISETGAVIAYLDTTNYFAGWKTVFSSPDAWVRYNTVQFEGNCRKVVLRVKAPEGGKLLLLIDQKTIAKIKVPRTEEWKEITVRVKGIKKGIHHLTAKSSGDTEVWLDWLRFTK